MSDLAIARERIQAARRYTLRLLEDWAPEDWFRQPKEGVTHLAWQVGHLAMAEYRLVIGQILGRRPEDAALISDEFIKQFSRESRPDPEPSLNPSPAEIRRVLDRVHERAQAEMEKFIEEKLAEPPLRPHSQCTTKLGSLFWCAAHEMVHAGQIGLLRRLFGKLPLW